MTSSSTAETFRTEFAHADTLWQAVKLLLEHWRAASPPDSARKLNDERYDAWSGISKNVRGHFSGERTAHTFDSGDRALLCAVTNDGQHLDAVDAAAWGMALATNHTFVAGWHEELGTDVHRLTDGELYPVPTSPWDLTALDTGTASITSQPNSLSNTRIGELPSVRVHDASRCDVTVDFSLEEPLELIFSDVDRVAAGQPNEHWDELEFRLIGHRTFPVRPVDAGTQLAVLEELVRQVFGSGALISVFPELCLSSGDAEALNRLVAEADEPRLIVAGSVHEEDEAGRRNTAYGLLCGYDEPLVHHKQVAFTDEMRESAPNKEGIDEPGRPALTVWQADRFRLGMAICKELLDDDHARLYDRLGVNTVLVPALSLKTGPFGPAVQARVAGAQALTIVVNGPRRGPTGARLAPDVIIGQPLEGKESTLVELADDAPSFYVIELG